jgi:hypothetical protein
MKNPDKKPDEQAVNRQGKGGKKGNAKQAIVNAGARRNTS